MKLLINPAGGMAGDMFSAALVSAGADAGKMQNAMITAGNKLGTTRIEFKKAPDNSTQLFIQLKSHRQHLGEFEAKEILQQLFNQLETPENYRNLGMRILEVLTKAEKRAHAEYNIVVEGDHSHSHHHHDHDHSHSHSHDHGHHHHHHDHHHHTHSHPHPHSHEHNGAEQAFLHEAQDIIIDIIGAVTGMQQLEIEPKATLLNPVSVGGGHIHFSHGTHSIPAPATTVILEEYNIPWKKGPIDVELFTPTGSAILAALESKQDESIDIETLETVSIGKSRGTKILEIPPLELYIYKD